MKRIKSFSEAYDKRDPDPNKNYGIHGIDMRMVLVGDKGAVSFVLYTNRHLRSVQQELVDKYIPEDFLRRDAILNYSGPFTPDKEISEIIAYHNMIESFRGQLGSSEVLFRALPADIGYHSPKPMWEGQKPVGSTRRKKEETLDEARKGAQFVPQSGSELEPSTGDALDELTKKMKEFNSKFEDTPVDEIPNCEYLGVPCYCDGSALRAEDYYEILVHQGEEALWKALEDYYHETFE